jgi:uncharacterized SAM-binding protein YcdF (DUF218 family)
MAGHLRKLKNSACIVLRIAILVVATWMLAWIAARLLVVKVKLEHADAVVVLSGSSTYLERTRWAAQVFNEGRTPRIIVTNDGLQGRYSIEQDRNPFFVELAVAELKKAGVPPDRIEVLTTARENTHQEAMLLRDYSVQHDLRALAIVTSAYHSRRALWTFEQAFRGSGISLGVEGPPPGLQTPKPSVWWLYALGWKLVPGEYLKLVFYHLRY